mmetsp:Transcript_3424/g.4318  ORF Transcript_3424/g.4318 Transcript_3424/m.4318 type:complete len:129 (+) Transcript_3424:298-684(+)
MKVGKNNFRPPPKVDSRVVRIEPRNPPPPVNFVEWDGMVRLCFNRKNKTLRSVFTTKSVLNLLEKNFRTYHALKNLPLPETFNTNTVKIIVEETLDSVEMSTTRSSKLDVDDFLVLLDAFNKRNIRFS